MVRNITLPTKSPLPNPCNQSKIITTSRGENIFLKYSVGDFFKDWHNLYCYISVALENESC